MALQDLGLFIQLRLCFSSTFGAETQEFFFNIDLGTETHPILPWTSSSRKGQDKEHRQMSVSF